MVVLHPLAGSRFLSQTELIKQIILQEQLMPIVTCLIHVSKHGFTCRFDALAQLFFMTSQHQLEQIGDGFSILLDLAFGSRVQDGQAGVNVPFVRIDAESDVDLHILNTTHISRHFPGELVVGRPSRAHGEESCMGDCLCVCGDAVVSFGCEFDVLAFETRQDFGDEIVAGVGGAVLDED